MRFFSGVIKESYQYLALKIILTNEHILITQLIHLSFNAVFILVNCLNKLATSLMDLVILVYLQIERNLAGENDVTFDVKFCGVCHSGKPEINNSLIFIN